MEQLGIFICLDHNTFLNLSFHYCYAFHTLPGCCAFYIFSEERLYFPWLYSIFYWTASDTHTDSLITLHSSLATLTVEFRFRVCIPKKKLFNYVRFPPL